METTGKVIQVLPIQEGVSKSTGNPWALQAFVIETLDQYPRKQYFEIFGKDKIDANLPKVDDTIKVSFDLESREYNGRWYTTARAWKVEAADAPQAAAQPMAPQPAPVAQPAAAPVAAPANPVEQLKAAVGGVEESTELPF